MGSFIERKSRACKKHRLYQCFTTGKGKGGLDSAGSGLGQVTGTCECGIEHSGSIKYGESLE
jgi:hypothetical protein